MRRISRVQLRMTYQCCGMEWTDEYALVLSIECPDCGVLVEPHDIAELKQPARTKKPKLRKTLS